MSDQAATQKKFNELLQDYKDGILPEVVDNWYDLTNEEQINPSGISNFFCGLYICLSTLRIMQMLF